MDARTIKVSNENYRWLLALASDLQKQLGKPVSFDETLEVLKSKGKERKKLSDLAGRWRMSDRQWQEIKDELKKGWGRWKISSV